MQKFNLLPTFGYHSFSDLEKLPNFRQNIKLTRELERSAVIIAAYKIVPDMIPCGLTCHQGHNRGYVLELSDDSHTNVGRNCGSNHFGASCFKDQVSKIEEAERVSKQKSAVNRLIDHAPKLRQRAHDLWHASKPLYDALEEFKKLFPDPISNDLRNRAQRRQYAVSITRKRDGVENMIDEGEAVDSKGKSKKQGSKKKSLYVEEQIGTLNGLQIFLIKPRSCLKDARFLLDELDCTDNNISGQKLARFAKYQGQIKEKLDQAEKLIAESDKFFEEDNFKLLPFLCDGGHRENVERIQWDFNSNTGQTLSYGKLKRLRKRAAS